MKRMRKTYSNIVMFGIQIYLHLPLFLYHIITSGDEAHIVEFLTIIKINSAILLCLIILSLSTILRTKVLNCQHFIPLRSPIQPNK